MPTIFDSHCHPQMEQYDNDRDEMLQRAFDAEVSMICVGTDLETSKQGIELAQKHDPVKSRKTTMSSRDNGTGGIWASVGLHPNDIPDEFRIEDFESFINKEKVIAIGEVGLDYYRTPEPEKQKKQKEVFEIFLDLATKHNKPIIIHSRDSAKGSVGHVHSDMISILDSRFRIYNSNLCGVAHSFTGNIDEAREYLNRGIYLGFNGIITFARQYDEAVKYAPLEQILLETDAPFLSPEPYRGKRNEPARVIEVAKKISALKNVSLDKIIEITSKNCQNLFKLNA